MESRFHWLDYVVTVAMLLVSLGIGFFFAFFKGGQKTKVQFCSRLGLHKTTCNHHHCRVQELCESQGGRPGLSVLMSLTFSVDVKQH